MIPFKEYHLFQFLDQLDSKTPLDLSISQYFRQHKSLGSKDRKFIAETTYTMIRWLALIDFFTQKPKVWEKRYETFRKLDFNQSLTDENIPLHIRASFPKFLFSKLIETFGEERALELAHLSNQRAPLTLRVNAQKISRSDFLSKMKKKFPMQSCEHSPVGIRLNEHVNLFQTEEFKDGWFEVQDEGSQLAAFLVDVKPKQKILDYCGGSGGKSLALAPLMNQSGCIYMHDIRPRILLQAKKRFKRAGIFHYQIMQPESKALKGLRSNMDWVLVDAPCSGTGTYRRNPDLKWKFNSEMLAEIIQLQRDIFDKAIQYLKPKGHIVYLTCSMLKDENEKQVEYFIQKHNLRLVNKPLNSATNFDKMDGFYGAILTYA